MSSAINKSDAGGGARPSLLRQMMAVRPIDPVPPGKDRLKQVLSARALIAIGLGATIGSGIFVLTGTVAGCVSNGSNAEIVATCWMSRRF